MGKCFILGMARQNTWGLEIFDFEKTKRESEEKENLWFYWKLTLKFPKKTGDFSMKDFTTYLSTAPVLTLLSVTVVAGLLIEINRFFPDALIAAF